MIKCSSSVNVLLYFLIFCKGKARANILRANAQLAGFILVGSSKALCI